MSKCRYFLAELKYQQQLKHDRAEIQSRYGINNIAEAELLIKRADRLKGEARTQLLKQAQAIRANALGDWQPQTKQ